MAHFLPVVGIVLLACTWGVVQGFVAPIILAGIERRARRS